MRKKILGVIAGLFLIVGLTQSGYADGPTCDYDGNLFSEISSEYIEDDGCTYIDVLMVTLHGDAFIVKVCLDCPECYNQSL